MARHALSQNPDFDLKATFKMLDRYHRGFLGTDAINAFLKYFLCLEKLLILHITRENHVFTSEAEILYIFDSYDKIQTGRLGLQE